MTPYDTIQQIPIVLDQFNLFGIPKNMKKLYVEKRDPFQSFTGYTCMNYNRDKIIIFLKTKGDFVISL